MAKRRISLDDWEEQHKAPVKKRPKVKLDLPDENQVWLTPPQAAAYLRLGVSTLVKMRSAMTGPRWSSPRPNSVRYRKDELDRWMAECMPVKQAAE
jgi:predicted DNA-binding transcriptional regulator AlpA